MPALLTRMSISMPSVSKRAKASTIPASLVTSKAEPSAACPAACISATAASTRAGSAPLTITRAPAFARPSAIARPSPREEPVTKAVRSERSNNACDMTNLLDVGAAHGQIGTLVDRRQEVDAEALPLHRIDVAVPDVRHVGDEFVIPALVEGTHGFLDQRIRLAERHVHGGSKADRTNAIVWCEGTVVGFGHGRDLAPLGEPAGPAQIRHHDMHRVAI